MMQTNYIIRWFIKTSVHYKCKKTFVINITIIYTLIVKTVALFLPRRWTGKSFGDIHPWIIIHFKMFKKSPSQQSKTGVTPLLVGLTISWMAPCLDNHCTIGKFPRPQAWSMGVSPRLFGRLISFDAPFWYNHLTIFYEHRRSASSIRCNNI